MKNKRLKYGKFARMLAVVLLACMLGTSLPTTGSTVSAGTSGTTVLDFNGTDFDTSITVGGSYITQTAYVATALSDTSGVSGEFEDGVYKGSNASYVATAVGFKNPLDLSKVTSVKVRMYVPTYTTTGDPELRIFNTEMTKFIATENAPTMGAWCEIELLDVLDETTITKNADNYLERFVIGYRVKASTAQTIYYDSIIIEYSDENYFVTDDSSDSDDTEVTSDYQVTLSSLYKVTYRDDGCWVVYFYYTGTLPSSYSYYVNVTIDGTTTESYRLYYDSDTLCYIGLWKHPSSYITLEAGLLTCSDTTASTVALTEDFSLSYMNDALQSFYLPTVDSWTTISAAQAFGTAPVTLTGNKSSSFTTLDQTEIQFTGAYIEGAGSSSLATNIYIGTDSDGWAPGIRFTLSSSSTVMTMYYYDSSSNRVQLDNLLTGESTLDLKTVYEEYTITTATDFAFRTQFVNEDVYMSVYVEGTLAGIYCSEGTASTFGTYIFGYSGGEGGSYYVESYENTNFVDVTFQRLSTASGVNGSTWNVYPIPENASAVPGTKWSTKFLNVAYTVDDVEYTANFTRANDGEGLYMTIPGKILDPAADGVTIVIKAGKYYSNDGSDGINITEDFTFYAVKGALTTEFDLDDPDYSSDVYCNIDTGSYTITDAETVTIDDVTYYMGDVYTEVGTHTLTYTMYERTYTRKLVIYRYGDLNDDGEINVCDLVRVKKYLDESVELELTDSALEGADMSCNDTVADNDVTLLRKYLVLGDGVLLLSPENGAEVAQASEAVETVVTDYESGKSAEVRNGEDIYYRDAIKVNWISKADVTEYQVLLATDEDMTDAFTYTTESTSLSLVNLLPDTTYYWQLVAGDYTSDVLSFHTSDTIRTLTIDGVSNTRDCGGYAAMNETTVKYGMIYRGGKLDDITDEGKYQLINVLGLKADLDLRTPGEGTAGSGCPAGEDVTYYNYDAPYYWSGLIKDEYYDALVNEIKVFANADNYPVYVHCSLGRDRTGTILLLINGLLGVSQDDLRLDYELSFLSSVGGGTTVNITNMMANFDGMYEQIQTYAPDGTFADACEAFMEEYCGITQDEIDTIRSLLLE